MNNQEISLTYNTSTLTFAPGESPSDFTVQQIVPIHLKTKNATVRLNKLNTWYSIYNFSSTYRNVVFTVLSGGGLVTTTVTIPSGIYSFDEFEEEFTNQVETALGVGLSPVAWTINRATGKITCTVTGVSNSISMFMESAVMFGFVISTTTLPNVSDYTVYEGTPVTSAYVVRWSMGIDSLCLECDLVSNSSVNGRSASVIATFTPRVQRFFPIEYEPFNPARLQVNKESISYIRFKLTDQSGNVVSLNGEHLVINIVITLLR